LLHAEALEQEILHRLHEPDEEMKVALERLRKNFYGPFTALREYRENPERLEGWRAAEHPSQDWRKGFYFEQALRLLATALYKT
jgi:hypothetical protein